MRILNVVMKKIKNLLLATLCLSTLPSCADLYTLICDLNAVITDERTDNGELALVLYKPVNFNGSDNIRIDTSVVLTGHSNIPEKQHQTGLFLDKMDASVALAVKDAIKHESPECIGLANVKLYKVSKMYEIAQTVEGNPVYIQR